MSSIIIIIKIAFELKILIIKIAFERKILISVELIKTHLDLLNRYNLPKIISSFPHSFPIIWTNILNLLTLSEKLNDVTLTMQQS